MTSRKGGTLIALTIAAACLLCSFTTFRQDEGATRDSVTFSKTPIDAKRGGTLWTRSLSPADGTLSYNSDPVICGSVIYIANSATLYELGRSTGEVLRTHTLTARTNSVCHLLLEGNRLMVPLSGGQVECVDTQTMTAEWVSRPLGDQSLSTLLYDNGYLYAGTTRMRSATSTTGIFYCIRTQDGSVCWTYEDKEQPGGYYWSGAVALGGRLYFTGDNGILVEHSLTTREVFGTIRLSATKIRAALTYDPDSGSLYTADTKGTVYRIPLSEGGQILKDEIRSGSAVPAASPASVNCTSTPSVWNGRLYVGSIANGYGHLSVLDAWTLSLIYTVRGERSAEIKSSPLISAGHVSAGGRGPVYVYVSANQFPGGIFFLKDDASCTSGSLQTLYVPAVARQFCMSSMTADMDGVLYYSNDSNTLFAVSEVETSSDHVSLPTNTVPSPFPTPSPLPIPTRTIPPIPVRTPPVQVIPSGNPAPPAAPSPLPKARKPQKPRRIRAAKKRGKTTISWTRQNKAQTILYIRYGKGARHAWQKKKMGAKTRYTTSKKGPTLYYRLQSRIRIGSGWICSGFTKTFHIRL